MSTSQGQIDITILTNEGEYRLELGIWGPINLIRVDVRLILKCIRLRLKTSHHTAYMKTNLPIMTIHIQTEV